MCTILQFRVVGPRISDGEILSAVSSFGFWAEDDRVWREEAREAVFYVDRYLIHKEEACPCPLGAVFYMHGLLKHEKGTCLCPLDADPDGQTRLRGLLEFLLPRCAELYYAPDIFTLDEEPIREIDPAAVHAAYRPGRIAPWGRVKMPEYFGWGLAHLVLAMQNTGVEADLDCSRGNWCFRVPSLNIEVSAREEGEAARELLAALTWLWAEYGTAADENLSGDALRLKRGVLALVQAGII